MFPDHITVLLFVGLSFAQVSQTTASTVSSLVTPTPSHTTSSSSPSAHIEHSSGSSPSVHIEHSSSSTYSTTKGLIASSLTTEGGPGPSSIISTSSVSVTPSSTPQPNQCSTSERPNEESTCGQYVIHLLKNPWKDEYLKESSMDYKELKYLLSSLFCDIFKDVASKVWLPELTFSKANGNWTIAKGKVCVVFKPEVDFYMEDAKLNFTTNYTFEAIGVTFLEWKAKVGECKKCDGTGGPFVIESVCESKEYSCRGHKNKSQESKDCVKYCPSASNLVVAAVSNLILAMWISLSFKQ